MLPLEFLRNMPDYEIKNNDKDTVKVTLVEEETHVDSVIAELRSKLGHLPLVGFDLKTEQKRDVQENSWVLKRAYEVLVFYIEDRCLIIKLDNMSHFPTSLSTFLQDKNICFVGMNIGNNEIKWRDDAYPFFYGRGLILKTGVNIPFLAAKVLKNPSLIKCRSEMQLAKEMGFHFKDEELQNGKQILWKEFCLSEEDVKFVMNKACICYKLGAFLRTKMKKEIQAADHKASSSPVPDISFSFG